MPSIQEGTYTTKLPADVDEEVFGPSSTSLPLPVPRQAGSDSSEVGFSYFIQKCRSVLAHLVLIWSLMCFQPCAACQERQIAMSS